MRETRQPRRRGGAKAAATSGSAHAVAFPCLRVGVLSGSQAGALAGASAGGDGDAVFDREFRRPSPG